MHDALAELATIDPRPSEVVELRFFGGFSVEETAETLGVSVRTVGTTTTQLPASTKRDDLASCGHASVEPRSAGDCWSLTNP